MKLVFTNAGPLMVLGKLNHLTLLTELYGSICVPRSVYREVVSAGMAQGRPDALTVRLFLARHTQPICEASRAVMEAYQPPVELDSGELELLALARGLPTSLVLLDDEVARSEARRLGLKVKGSLGVLVQAHRANLLPFDKLELLLLEIAARPDIWISEKLCQSVLDELRP